MKKKKKNYVIVKKNKFKSCKLKLKKNSGFKVAPKNTIKYEGVKVTKLLILKKKYITKLLKKKIKRKLNLYLDLFIDITDLDDATDDGEALRESLNELSRFKDIIRYKYKKYLDAKYTKLLIKKIELLEYEINERIVLNNYKYIPYEEEVVIEKEEEHKRRR